MDNCGCLILTIGFIGLAIIFPPIIFVALIIIGLYLIS